MRPIFSYHQFRLYCTHSHFTGQLNARISEVSLNYKFEFYVHIIFLLSNLCWLKFVIIISNCEENFEREIKREKLKLRP